MNFSSIVFLALFMPICVCGYFLADKKYRNTYLCVASAVFYAWSGLSFLIYATISTALAFGAALLIEKVDVKFKKPILIVSLIYNLGVLFYFKYFVTFAETILRVLKIEGVNVASVALPLGISFYTFSIISYVVDVYWEKCSAQKKFGNLFLYVMLFPKVVQGPIMRYTDFESQIDDRTVDYVCIRQGLERFIKGLFKKVVIADALAPLVNDIFANIVFLNSVTAWIGIIGYMLQLYYDFSGYTDMALGLGRMFGFKLPENFDHPYMAASIPEFWRRWHTSLGDWFKDYVYMPVYRTLTSKKNPATGKKYSQLFRDVTALFVTWCLVGQWHGAGIKFFIYGLWYYIFIVIDRLRDERRKKLKKKGIVKPENKFVNVLYRIMSLVAIIMAQTLFRADSVSIAAVYLKKMFLFNGIIDEHIVLQFSNSVILAFVIGFIFIFPVYDWVKNKVVAVASKNKVVANVGEALWCLLLLAVYVIVFGYIAASGYSAFLYQVF